MALELAGTLNGGTVQNEAIEIGGIAPYIVLKNRPYLSYIYIKLVALT